VRREAGAPSWRRGQGWGENGEGSKRTDRGDTRSGETATSALRVRSPGLSSSVQSYIVSHPNISIVCYRRME
jgi:hypothetical protein